MGKAVERAYMKVITLNKRTDERKVRHLETRHYAFPRLFGEPPTSHEQELNAIETAHSDCSDLDD